MFGVWYTYDDDREPVFLIGTLEHFDDGSFSGPVHRQRNGTPLLQIDGQPPSQGSDLFGSVSLQFDDGESGRFTHTIVDVTIERPIRRLLVGDVPSECASITP